MTRPSSAALLRKLDRLIGTAKPGEESLQRLLTSVRADLQETAANEPKQPARKRRTVKRRTAEIPLSHIVAMIRDAASYAPPAVQPILQRCETILVSAVDELLTAGREAFYNQRVPKPPSRKSRSGPGLNANWLLFATDVVMISTAIEARLASKIAPFRPKS